MNEIIVFSFLFISFSTESAHCTCTHTFSPSLSLSQINWTSNANGPTGDALFFFALFMEHFKNNSFCF